MCVVPLFSLSPNGFAVGGEGWGEGDERSKSHRAQSLPRT